jgi:hypothetical protein
MHLDSTILSDITGTRDKGVGTGRCAAVKSRFAAVTGAAKGCRLQATGFRHRDSGGGEKRANSRQPKEVKARRGIVDFDKLLDFLYDYQCGVWTYGVLIIP